MSEGQWIFRLPPALNVIWPLPLGLSYEEIFIVLLLYIMKDLISLFVSCVQYEREVPSAAPPNDVETQYTGHLLDWLDNQLSNSSELLYGRVSSNVTVVGEPQSS